MDLDILIKVTWDYYVKKGSSRLTGPNSKAIRQKELRGRSKPNRKRDKIREMLKDLKSKRS